MNCNRVKYNLHTHSLFCDGKSSLSEYLTAALRNNIDVLGFSSHAPVKFHNHFSIKVDFLQAYVDEIRRLSYENNQKISLFAGLDCDYIPHFSYSFDEFRNKYKLDYLIGGIHLVENPKTQQLWFIDGPLAAEYDRGLNECFDNDIKKGVTQYFYQMMEMIENQHFEILAHFDKIKMHNAGRYFSEEDVWYSNLCLDVIDLLKNRDIIVEINTRGVYKKRCPDFYPSNFILKHLLRNKVRITLSSDAHHHEELDSLIDDAAISAKSVGYKEVWCIDKSKNWVPILL